MAPEDDKLSQQLYIKQQRCSASAHTDLGRCNIRVKSDNFGHQVNSDSDLVCFIF